MGTMTAGVGPDEFVIDGDSVDDTYRYESEPNERYRKITEFDDGDEHKEHVDDNAMVEIKNEGNEDLYDDGQDTDGFYLKPEEDENDKKETDGYDDDANNIVIPE